MILKTENSEVRIQIPINGINTILQIIDFQLDTDIPKDIFDNSIEINNLINELVEVAKDKPLYIDRNVIIIKKDLFQGLFQESNIEKVKLLIN